ncbi:MAG: hypothetical protein JSR73_10270 [Proteobacteria bacterium]|nr:hypothetical protein [Pseudomonadota bacterium]
MTIFILVGAAMVSVALALVAWPLWKGRAGEGRGTIVAIALVALALPLGAGLLYRSLSTWSWEPGGAPAAPGQHPLEEMVAKLEKRLAQNPGDTDGWLLLGRSYFMTQRYGRASEAFAKAYALSGGKNTEAVIAYGETLALADQGTLKGRAGELFEEALKLDPGNPKALFYGGAAAAAHGNLTLARERWATLLHQELPAEVKSMIAQNVQEADRELGRAPDPEIVRLASASAPPAGAPAAAAAAPAPAGPVAPAPGKVTVHVKLSPSLAAKVPAGAPLFVLARDPTQPGPPFGARRFAGAALPMDVQLTEADAMLPTRTIRSAKQLVIVARFSASGMPTSSSGDLYGEVPYDLAKGAAVDLVIDKQVP